MAKVNATTYIGGEIINPKMDQVILSRDNSIIDTLQLDHNNHFLFKSDTLESGLYSFKHGEYQKFYLEPGDSLILRVNTVDFDESLSYTGKGSDRNNLLMDFFLSNEEENQSLQLIAQLSASEFEKKIDSMRNLRVQSLNELLQEGNESESYLRVARAAIDYDYYSKKELFISKNKNPERRAQIPATFYDFRNEVAYGDKILTTYYPYYQFLNRHLNNLAFEALSNNKDNHTSSFQHTQKKLDLIDKTITYDTLKNNLLRATARAYLLQCSKPQLQQQVVEKYQLLSSNDTHKSQMNQILDATLKLTPGEKIPSILVVDAENMSMDIAEVIKKPTVIYFWSYHSIAHYKNIHTRAAELKERYPEYDFIGINTDNHFRRWRTTIGKNGFPLKREYQFENSNQAEKDLVLTSINKAIVVDENGVILESNTNLLKLTFESELLGFLN